MKRRIWIDTDGGVDDALALTYALENSNLDVRGISTVGGNVIEDKSFLNMKHILSLFNREDIPVVRGENKPLKRKLIGCNEVHGVSGLGWIRPRQFDYNGENIEEALSKTDAESIVCLGPLSNIASNLRAIESNSSIRNIHALCGTIDQPNFHTGEYNLYVDPEAAARVLKSQKEIFLYGTELCDSLLVPSLLIDNQAQEGLKRNTLDLLLQWFDLKPLYDPTAVIGSLSQDFFKAKKIKVVVSRERGKFREDSKGREVNFLYDSQGIMEEFAGTLFKSKPYKKMTILSPHIDDVFLSLGGTILGYDKHFSIDIINVFSNSAYSRFPVKNIPQKRMAEDENCFRGLNVRRTFLGLPDWTMRGYSQWNSKPVESEEYFSALKKRINKVLRPNSVLLNPMGVGGCVDHSILANLRLDVPFQLSYEDLPYADYPELVFPRGHCRLYKIDITKRLEEKLDRLQSYNSQLTEQDLERVNHHSEFRGKNYENLWRAG